MTLWRQLIAVWTVAIGASVVLFTVDLLGAEHPRSYLIPLGVGASVRFLRELFHIAPLTAVAVSMPILAIATTIALVVWRLARGTT